MKFFICANILFINFALISIATTLNIPNDEDIELDEQDIYVGVENAVIITSSLAPFNSSFDIYTEKPTPRFQFRQKSNSYCAPELEDKKLVIPEIVCLKPAECILEKYSPRELFDYSLKQLISNTKSSEELYQQLLFITSLLQSTYSKLQELRHQGYRSRQQSGYGNIPEQQYTPLLTQPVDSDENDYVNHNYSPIEQPRPYSNVGTRQSVSNFPREMTTYGTQQDPQNYSIRRSYTSPDGSYHNSYNYHSYRQTYGTTI